MIASLITGMGPGAHMVAKSTKMRAEHINFRNIGIHIVGAWRHRVCGPHQAAHAEETLLEMSNAADERQCINGPK